MENPLASGRALAALVAHTRSVEGVAISPDGAVVASASAGPVVCRTSFGLFGGSIGCGPGPGIVRPFGPASGRQRAKLRHGYVARSEAFSPAGKYLASGGGVAKLRDLATNDARTIIEPQDDLSVYRVAFTPDGSRLAVGPGSPDFSGSGGEVRLWDVAEGRVRSVLRGEMGKVRSLAFAPDGRTLVTGSSTAVVLWGDDQHAPSSPAPTKGDR